MDHKSLFSKNSVLWEITNPEYTKYRRYRIAIIFSIIAAVMFMVFIADDLIAGSNDDTLLDGAFFIFFASFPFVIVKLKRTPLWFLCIILACIGMIVRMIYTTGETMGGALVWFLAIPIVSFLLLGTRLGFVPSVLCFLVILFIFIFPDFANFKEALTVRFKFHLSLAFCIVTGLSWLYEFDREKLEKTLRNAGHTVHLQKEQLSEANSNLKIMMVETNHRVKNNLAVVCSLIYLYQNSGGTKKQVLTELHDKILSIGKLHEMLYKSSTLSQIPMQPYLQDIVSQLAFSYALMNQDISADIDDITFEPDIAIRIGLIATELVINACKYGIQSGGVISVRLKKTEDGYLLSVANNGRLLPENMDISNSGTMGFSIIMSMAEFLKAEVSVTRQPQTCIDISFNTG